MPSTTPWSSQAVKRAADRHENDICCCGAGLGVSNRDVKLENTLLDGSRRPLLKLCDFGYSKADTDSLPKSVVGTPGYTGNAHVAAG